MAAHRLALRTPPRLILAAAVALALAPATGLLQGINAAAQTAPQILSTASLDGHQIGVCFDQTLDAATASDPSRYTLNDSLTPATAALQSDGRSVRLSVNGLTGDTFRLGVNGVKNPAGQFSTLIATGQVVGLWTTNLGTPTTPGSGFACSAQAIDLRAGGIDIWSGADACTYLQREWLGDFDVSVQIAGFDSVATSPQSHYTRGGLMVRESLDPASRNLLAGTYAVNAAVNKWLATARLATGAATDLIPGNSFPDRDASSAHPNAWVRMKRNGNIFTCYYATNGITWTPLGDPLIPSPAYPSRVFLGLGASANDAVQTASVRFRNLQGFRDDDTNAPTIVSVHNFDLASVLVRFSEGISPASATNRSSYRLSDGAEVLGAILIPPQDVLLNTSPLATNTQLTLTVNDVRDLALAANRIATNSTISFTVNPAGTLQYAAVGGGLGTGTVTSVENGGDLSGPPAPNGLSATEDQFHFDYQLRRGDFDVRVRLDAYSAGTGSAVAGLMARENLASESRYASTLLSSVQGGALFASRSTEASRPTHSSALPSDPPSSWLRLKRNGATFSGLASSDGEHWTVLGSVTLDLPDTLFLGFALAGEGAGPEVTARFREFGAVIGGVVEPRPTVSEPLSASSRRTGLVLSEIMYHPQPRPDGRSLEFVEVYNSQVFLEDISGYRLSGSIDYTFPPDTVLQPGAFVVVAKDAEALRAAHPSARVTGPFTNSLPNDAGTVRLRNRAGAVLLEVNYESRPPWPRGADGTGHSLVLAQPSYGEDDPRAWAASEVTGGSPGALESSGTQDAGGVVINEFLAGSAGQTDFIELFNHSTREVDISGCFLSDDPATNKFRIPSGTILPPLGFALFQQATLGFGLSSAGETLYLVSSNAARLLDVVDFGPQAAGIPTGRAPDGSPTVGPLARMSPGAPNDVETPPSIVISEIMHHPISGNIDDEYVELHNRGAEAVDLGGWQFIHGIRFSFPSNSILAAGGYLVVARNAAHLIATRPTLTPANTFGNYSGSLADGSERLTLAKPASGSPGALLLTVNEITYGAEGPWGRWADGGGSSLELIDTRADNRRAMNWADSDETGGAPWTFMESTGVLDFGGGIADVVQIVMLGEGECLIDDVEVLSGTSTNNLVANSGFQSGTAGWVFQGNHDRSFHDPTGGYNGGGALHVVAAGRGDTGANRIYVPLRSAVPVGGTGTLRMKVRWLRGDPNLLLRFHGNYLEIAGTMNLPPRPGTPAQPNSRRVANAGPAIWDVSHHPVLPAAGEPVLVTARVADPDGIDSLELRYRVDPATNILSVLMHDDGADGDAVADDGLYTAILPGQAAGVLAAFHLRANDGAPVGVASLFPAGAPSRECLVRFGEQQPPGNIATYRLWMTQATFDRWSTRLKQDNTELATTFVYGNSRAIYNVGAKYKGSWWSTSGYTGPTGALCGYRLTFPDHDRLLGVTDVIFDFPLNDPSGQAQQTAYWLAQELGVPYNHRRFIQLFVNGAQRGAVYEDSQQPNGDVVREFFPGDSDGGLYKLEAWIEYTPDVQLEGFWEHMFLRNWNTTGGVKKRARYRWSFMKRALEGSAHDFDDVYRLVEAANLPTTTPAYAAQMNALAEVEEWLRVFAVEHIVGNWDSYSYNNGHNMYLYQPQRGRWSMLMFDIDFSFGIGSQPSSDPLFIAQDPAVQTLFTHPPFRRLYLRAFQDAVNGPLTPARSNPVLDSKYQGLLDNGINASSPDGIKSYIAARRSFILAQLAPYAKGFAVTNAVPTATNQNVISLSGTAPLELEAITINGVAWPLTWISENTWRLIVPLTPGANSLAVAALDRNGAVLTNLPQDLRIEFTAAAPSPVDAVVINEIMFHPADPAASFVEIHNRTTNSTFDLSGWRLDGLNYSFPPGTLLTNRQFLVVANNRQAFARAYGVNCIPVGEFPAPLDRTGQVISLVRPGGTGDPGDVLVVDRLRYEPAAPWPTEADGGVFSLQLRDATRDNRRVSNWATDTGWHLAQITGVAASSRLYAFLNTAGDVYVDDISLVAGTVAESGANLVRNGGFESVLSTNQGGPWIVPANMTTSAIVTNLSHSGRSCLHLVSTSPGGGVNFSMFQDIIPIVTNTTYTLSFWYLPTTNASVLTLRTVPGSGLISAPNVRPVPATPGLSNSTVSLLPEYPTVWLNEVLPGNTRGIRDASGSAEPWIELYNDGSAIIPLDGFSLSDDYANLRQWTFPAGSILNPGEFRIVFLDAQPDEQTAAEWHASFRPDPTRGSIVLSRLLGDTPQVLDYLNYAVSGSDRSFGSLPDGDPLERRELLPATPGAGNTGSSSPHGVRINEWMAANGGAARDPADGRADDWFELYNTAGTSADLGGYYLSDDPADPFQFQIPANGQYVIPARGFLLVWADGETNQNNSAQADLHANFKLSQGGEAIGLFTPAGTAIDVIRFGSQTNNISEGRYPDGAIGQRFLAPATPRAPNAAPWPPAAPQLGNLRLHPDRSISFSFTAAPGTRYRIDYKEQLHAPDWTPIGGLQQVPASGEVIISDQPGPDSQRFYRVLLLP